MNCGAILPSGMPALERRLRSRSSGFVSRIVNLRQNHLLAALTPGELLRLQSHLELVPMPVGQVLYESGGAAHHAYFPSTSIVSLLYAMEDGACSEIALAGKEGVLGVPVFMGDGTSPNQAVVLCAGYGYRIKAQFLLDEFNRGGPLLHQLLRYTQALMTQIAQTAVCNRHHMLYQQLCRFLLSILDRQESNQIILTQELIAEMLGRRREGVTEAAGKLQHDGLIRCSRGHIDVLDRRGLEANACECYQVVKREYERLLMQRTDRRSGSKGEEHDDETAIHGSYQGAVPGFYKRQ